MAEFRFRLNDVKSGLIESDVNVEHATAAVCSELSLMSFTAPVTARTTEVSLLTASEVLTLISFKSAELRVTESVGILLT